MILSKSAQLYRERKGLTPTTRGPIPRMVTNVNPVHTYPLQSPKPLPQFTQDTNGDPGPDGGLTTVWPHGESDE
jgi:hypothetical protein